MNEIRVHSAGIQKGIKEAEAKSLTGEGFSLTENSIIIESNKKDFSLIVVYAKRLGRRTKMNIYRYLNSLLVEVYYLPTIEVANLTYEMIQKRQGLNQDEWSLVEGLKTEDIHVLLSHKH